jgi:hypothetical protein
MDEKFGLEIDRIDNLIAGLNLPMAAEFHITQLKLILPEISQNLKDLYIEMYNENPWE